MLFILGAGGFAREVALVLNSNLIEIDGYLSDDPKQMGIKLSFARCLGSIEAAMSIYSPGLHYFVPGIGSPQLRRELVNRALQAGMTPANFAIDKDALLPKDKNKAHFLLGEGCVICRGVSGTVDITIGNYVNVNLNCTLGHDCTLEDYVNLSPSVNISGYCYLEEGVDVGTGAVILPHVRIGKGSVIGAGAVVTKDVPPGEVWIGTPAKFLRTIE